MQAYKTGSQPQHPFDTLRLEDLSGTERLRGNATLPAGTWYFQLIASLPLTSHISNIITPCYQE
jgi:hypothetical protein